MPLADPFGPAEIDWVFLDAYSTVVQEDYALLVEACHEMARSTHGRHGSEEIGAWWEERFHALCEASNADRFVLQREIVAHSLGDTVRHFRADLDQGQWLEAVFAYGVRPMLHHDTRAFFDACTTPICIVSNIDHDDLRRALEYAGVEARDVVTSESARSYKPDPGIFREALRKTGARPERVLHVGDSYRADVVGAVALGLHAAWLNRTGKPRPPEAVAEPNVEIRSLLDLLAP